MYEPFLDNLTEGSGFSFKFMQVPSSTEPTQQGQKENIMSENTPFETADVETTEAVENAEVENDDNPNTADETLVTAYQAAKIVNALLEEDGARDPETDEPKEIAPQMLYGYVRSGRLPSVEVKVGDKVQKRIRLADLGTWYKEYRAGNVGRGGSASTKSLVEGLKATLK